MKKSDQETHAVPRTGHIYDGIEELDHAPPNWFRALFYGTILFGIAYWLHYTFGQGPSILQEYENDHRVAETAHYARLAKEGAQKPVTENELRVQLKDPVKKKLGSTVYQSKCASCHGAEGQGGIGPNLTDSYWIHGGTLSAVLTTINRGVADKGMPPWASLLSANEAAALTVYIRSLAGTKPAGSKAPQGLKVSEQ